MTRADLLREHVAEVAEKTPIIGIDDCAPWVAQWIEKASGRRIIVPAYMTSEEGYSTAAAAGGLVQLVEPLLAAAGLWTTPAPVLGDVGIIRLSDRDTAVIFCSNGLALVRDERKGARYIRPANVLKAWALP